jgi:two-component system NtrC family sensor kinase
MFQPTEKTEQGSGDRGSLVALCIGWLSYWWRQLYQRHLSNKLILLLTAAMLVTFGLLGYANITLHRHHLEAATLSAAERVSDTVKRSTQYHMLRNDREAMYQIIRTIGAEPGIVRIRILNPEGRISYSSDQHEINQFVDKSAEACYGCHAQAQPLTRLNRPDRFRIYKPNGNRVLGVIDPIENQPSCSNADCHAHPASQQILGVLDINMSLATTDAALAETTKQMAYYFLVGVVAICVVSFVFIRRVVHTPVKVLTEGTKRLTKGELGLQLPVESDDEVGELADSFNLMSLRLRDANEEITSWARTLEERVEQKSNELKKAHDHLLQAEKMASIGKLAAVVAHEVNNPLSGILTYSKLIKKWIDNGDLERRPDRMGEARQCLDLVESESRRCGDLVRNLLTFSRAAPMNLSHVELNPIIERCVKLVQHQLEMNSIQWQMDLDPDLPTVYCDAAQIEQVLLALVMNAVDAMPRGGNLWLRSRYLPESRQVVLQVRDDGAGISPDVLPKLFEPFVTTKESGKGVGLGLAISKSIIERHKGKIEVESELGRGTCFHIVLPLDASATVEQAANEVKPAGAGVNG